MNIVTALVGEHGPLRSQIDALALAAPRMTVEQLRAAALALSSGIDTHATLEDELLFAPLAASGQVPAGDVEGMFNDHRQIEALLAQLVAPLAEPARADPQETVARLAALVRRHFEQEENVLFPAALRALDADELEELGARWADRRGIDVGGLELSTFDAVRR